MSRVRILAAPEDVWGFGLAGVEGRTPRTEHALREELQRAAADGIELLLVSREVAGLAPPAVEALAEKGARPAVLVLPEAPP